MEKHNVPVLGSEIQGFTFQLKVKLTAEFHESGALSVCCSEARAFESLEFSIETTKNDEVIKIALEVPDLTPPK